MLMRMYAMCSSYCPTMARPPSLEAMRGSRPKKDPSVQEFGVSSKFVKHPPGRRRGRLPKTMLLECHTHPREATRRGYRRGCVR
jgi:hypothetical protein